MLEPPPATDGPQVVMPARRRLMWHDFTTGDSRFDDRTEKVRVPAAPEPPWNGTMQCCVRALYVDRNRHIGSLFMDICNGTDMYGCIGLFQSLDPGVRQIATWQSDGRRHNLEVVYRLNTDNEWEAIEPPAPVSRFGGVITPDNCRYLVPYPMVENATVSSWRETRPINYPPGSSW